MLEIIIQKFSEVGDKNHVTGIFNDEDFENPVNY